MNEDDKDKLKSALVGTTSSRRRRILFTDIHQKIECEPYILDRFIGYALENNTTDPDEFLETLSAVQEYIDANIPLFLERNAEELLPKITSELIDFYQSNGEHGNSFLAERIQEMSDEGKMVFEFPLYYLPRGVKYYSPKYFNRKTKLEWSYYDYRDFAEIADAVILYHGTSSVFEGDIKRNGLCPPDITDEHLIYSEDYKAGFIERNGIQKYKEFVKSYEDSRKYSVYFSTARLDTLRGGPPQNGDVEGYMERAKMNWGGNEKLYICIVPTDRLVPDEDAKTVREWIESIFVMNSAKINGCLEPEYVFPVKNNLVPRLTSKSETLKYTQKKFNETNTILDTYLSENPIEKLVAAV